MFKVPIKYRSFSGEEKEGTYYFNLNKGEMAKLHVILPGGLDGIVEKLKSDAEVADIINVFEKIILMSYGKRTAEGRFIKSKEYTDEFAASDAYSELFLKFLENENDFVNKFMEGIMNVPAGDLKKAIEDAAPQIEALQAEPEIASDF